MKRRLWWAWFLGATLSLGCAHPGGSPPPILCSRLEVDEATELVALPSASRLKAWVVFTDQNTCMGNQSIYRKLGYDVPENLERPMGHISPKPKPWWRFR